MTASAWNFRPYSLLLCGGRWRGSQWTHRQWTDEWAGPRPVTEMTEKNREFRALGFRCLHSTAVCFLDGSTAMVGAHSFRDSKMRSDDDVAPLRALRIYEVNRGGTPGTELVTELELEGLIGQEQFNRLA